MSKITQVARAAGSITIAVFLSRILGLVREQVLAYFFGAGRSMDAFVVAYRIPNLLRDLFAEGALGAAFTKVFSSSLVKKDLKESFKIASILLSDILVLLFIIVFLGIIFSPDIVALIAPEFTKDPDKFILTVNLTRIMMPFLLFISLSAVVAGMLNSLKIFFIPALSSAIFNLTSISIGVVGYFIALKLGIEPIYSMAIGVLLGGAAQLVFQLPLLWKKGFSFRFKINFFIPEAKEIAALIVPVIFGLSVVQVNIFINTFFATSCGEGAVSWYAYAFRIMYVPLGLFGVGLSQALLPELTKELSAKKFEMARELYFRALILSFSLSLPSAVGLYLLAKEIIEVLFQRGAFTVNDTIATASLLKIFSFALPFYAFSKATVPLFYSLKRTIIPTIGSVLAVLINILVILFSINKLGIKAVALGTTLSLIGQALFLFSCAMFYMGLPEVKRHKKDVFALFIGVFLLFVVVFLIKITLSSSFFKVLWGVFIGGGLYILIIKFLGPKDTYYFFKRFLPFL